MLTLVIRDSGESSVVKYTYEDLYKEIKDIEGFQLLVSPDWFSVLPDVTNKYICFVESDCLVTPDYFKIQLKALTENLIRRTSMLTSATAVKYWKNRFFGYQLGEVYDDFVLPVSKNKSNTLYPIQVGYVPGAIIRVSMLEKALASLGDVKDLQNDLVYLSTQLSLAFWQQGLENGKGKNPNGNPVYINPNQSYLTTEEYVNDVSKFDLNTPDLLEKFQKESI